MILELAPTEYIMFIKIMVDSIVVLYVDAYTREERMATYERNDINEKECQTFADESGLYPIVYEGDPLFIRGWQDVPF